MLGLCVVDGAVSVKLWQTQSRFAPSITSDWHRHQLQSDASLVVNNNANKEWENTFLFILKQSTWQKGEKKVKIKSYCTSLNKTEYIKYSPQYDMGILFSNTGFFILPYAHDMQENGRRSLWSLPACMSGCHGNIQWPCPIPSVSMHIWEMGEA